MSILLEFIELESTGAESTPILRKAFEHFSDEERAKLSQDNRIISGEQYFSNFEGILVGEHYFAKNYVEVKEFKVYTDLIFESMSPKSFEIFPELIIARGRISDPNGIRERKLPYNLTGIVSRRIQKVKKEGNEAYISSIDDLRHMKDESLFCKIAARIEMSTTLRNLPLFDLISPLAHEKLIHLRNEKKLELESAYSRFRNVVNNRELAFAYFSYFHYLYEIEGKRIADC